MFALRLIEEINNYVNQILIHFENVFFILGGNDLQSKAIGLAVIDSILILDHSLCYSNFVAPNPLRFIMFILNFPNQSLNIISVQLVRVFLISMYSLNIQSVALGRHKPVLN